MRRLSLAWFPGRGAKRRILEKTRRRGPGVLRPERTRSPAECSHGDESCVTRFSGGTDEKRRGIPATVRKVVWQGFPGERTRSPAGSRNVHESCVASLLFIWVGGSGRRPSHIRRPRPACGAMEYSSSERSSMKYSTLKQGGGVLGSKSGSCVPVAQNRWFILVKLRILVKTRRRGRGLSHTKSYKRQYKVKGLSP